MSTELTGIERVRRAIIGLEVDRTPVYGWLSANLSSEITAAFGSLAAFEAKYAFDAVHLFPSVPVFDDALIERLRSENEELDPEELLAQPFHADPHAPEGYAALRRDVDAYHALGRFCYAQTPGFFECFNGVFGIEEQLLQVAASPEALGELYARQADWTIAYADHCIDAGVDMVHISDDWGAQSNLMFSPDFWRSYIKPNLKRVIDRIHDRGCLASLHSDGCINPVVDELTELGIDCVHPWQESAGMSYADYLTRYADSFAIMGGVCIQRTLGFGDLARLEAELRRVFGLLRGHRWICCTTHFVQEHCSMDELVFAYDLIYRLARGEGA
ncbi:MAG: hypothetical protein IKM07_06305 [Clostridia bacterium]|nr:hypothetical protein [Clostridia bacterium]